MLTVCFSIYLPGLIFANIIVVFLFVTELDDCLSAFSSATRIPDQTKYLRQVWILWNLLFFVCLHYMYCWYAQMSCSFNCFLRITSFYTWLFYCSCSTAVRTIEYRTLICAFQVGEKLKTVEDEQTKKNVCKLLTQHYYQLHQKSSMKRAIAR